jgi:hypothetical protein
MVIGSFCLSRAFVRFASCFARIEGNSSRGKLGLSSAKIFQSNPETLE